MTASTHRASGAAPQLGILTTLCLSLAACGGGGGSGSPPNPPAANSSPTFTSSATATVAENQANAYTATASDANAGDTLSFSISGGSDAALFSIAAGTGELAFVAAPDFETPQDAGTDNIYNVDLAVGDGRGGTDSLGVAITVTDVSTLELAVTFPTENAELGGDATEIFVAGNLIDLEDGETLASDIQFIDVNGVAGAQAMTDSSRWSAVVPVATPDTQVDVSVRPASGADLTSSFALTNQEKLLFVDQLVVDAANNRAIVPVFSGTLLAVDLTSGLRTVFSGDNVGAGPTFSAVFAVAIDAANDVVFASAGLQSGIYEIALGSGDRSLIANFDTGTGPDFTSLRGMCFYATTGHLIAVDRQEGAVVDIDPATGNRQVISDASTGTGTVLSNPEFIACDMANDRVLVLDRDRLHAVDIATGDRTVLSENYTNAGPVVDPSGMLFDAMNNRVLTTSSGLSEIVTIDLATGDREVVSSASVGAGQDIREPAGFAWDATADHFLVLEQGREILHRVSSVNGDRTIVSSNSVGAGPSTSDYSYFDQSADALFVSQYTQDDGYALHRVDKTNGNKTIISRNDTGSGDPLFSTFDVFVRESTNTAYWSSPIGLDQFEIVAIDLATGDRTTISSEVTGTGPITRGAHKGEVDDAGNRLVLADLGLNAIVAVDLTTGNRTILSDAATGSGTIFEDIFDLALEPGNQSALVSDGLWSRIFRVDLTTGDRTIVADSSTGGGTAFQHAGSISVDRDNNIAYFLCSVASESAIVSIDLGNLERSVVSGTTVGRGPELQGVQGLAFEAAGRRLFVGIGNVSGLGVVDVATGDRAILSR